MDGASHLGHAVLAGPDAGTDRPLRRLGVRLELSLPSGCHTHRRIRVSVAGRSVRPAGRHLLEVQVPEDGMEEDVEGAEVHSSSLRSPDG